MWADGQTFQRGTGVVSARLVCRAVVVIATVSHPVSHPSFQTLLTHRGFRTKKLDFS